MAVFRAWQRRRMASQGMVDPARRKTAGAGDGIGSAGTHRRTHHAVPRPNPPRRRILEGDRPRIPEGSRMMFEDHVCAVCRRSAAGYGCVPAAHGKQGNIAWTCDDPECLRLAREAYTALQRNFSRWESLAAQAGGREAGQYLDELGVTDLAKLTVDQ